MIRKLLLGFTSVVLFACNNESSHTPTTEEDSVSSTAATMNNTLTEDEKKDGWELLFDGVSTKGWHRYGDAGVGAAWKVADGNLYLDATNKENWQVKDGGDIVSDNEYDNFELKLDWKIDTSGNSGIIFYINEDSVKYERSWHTGMEMQVLDNNGHPDAKIIKHRAGDLYDLISSSKETVKPALEWNQVRIQSKDGKLDLYLNDENVVSTTLWDNNWKKLIAGSKFKSMPGFGIFKKGRIGLQDHGDVVWFRNIKIRKI